MFFAGRLIWKAVQAKKAFEERISKNLDRVGVFLQNEVRMSFGSPDAYPEGGIRNKRGKKISAKKFRQMQHSQPDDPPFVQTGMLRRSISYQREGTKKLLLGSTLKPQNGSEHSYAFWLELGSTKMEARPYLRPAVRNNRRTILQMITQ
jgi:HK97 gp10 family phage protein